MSNDLDRAARRLLRECIRAYRCEDIKNDFPDWSLDSAAYYLLQKAGIDLQNLPTDEELSQ